MESSFGDSGAPEAAAAGIATLGIGVILVLALIGLVSLLLTVILWWKIFAKAGWSGAMGLLMLVPLVNIIMFFVLAFAKWPIQRELEALKRGQ